MLTVDDCLSVKLELDDCTKAAQVVARKCRNELADDAARVLLSLLEEHDEEELVGYVLQHLENMPINYFETVLEYDSKLDDLYNEF